jgi:alpha-galactosidase
MKYILWYSVPFVGPYTDAWSRFKDKMLHVPTIGGAETGVLDPRFPEVREFLIQTYVDAMQDWDLDGFKLDFVDSFAPPRGQQPELGGGRDYDSLPVAVDRLLTDVIERLRAIKPDVMIEFRQSYVGPLMRKYGNMFRAADCPNDSIENRVRTLDVRLIAGTTATHADMLMWSVHDPVESAALQLVNVLFSVPQISVCLDQIPSEHVEMLRFWLGFWREHRDALLDGELTPLHPELLYPVVIASTPAKRIVAVYHESVIEPGAGVPDQLLLVNGTLKESIVVDLAEPLGERQIEVRDCRGQVVRDETLALSPGLHRLEVPPAGLVAIKAIAT